MTRGTITPAGGHKPRHAASLICWRFSAKFTASRIRLSCHGDFGSHWSANSTQKIDACFEDTTCIRGSRLRPSASGDRKSTRLNSSHGYISYAVFCLKKKKKRKENTECV